MLRRHATGTSILLVVVLGGALLAAAASYLADRPDEYRAEAAMAVVPVERLDDAEALDAYAALDASGVAATLAAAAQRQANAELDDGSVSMSVVDDSSMIVATGTAENRGDAEGIADDGVAALGDSSLLRGPFEVERVTTATGTATRVDPPWSTWALVAGVGLIGLVLIQQLVSRGLHRRHRRLDLDDPDVSDRQIATTVDPVPAPVVQSPARTGAATNGNGAGRPLEELSPIAWSAPPPD